MKRLLSSVLITLFAVSIASADTTKPWTFWYWMYGAVTETGIRADLQAMKDVGLGGCYLMPIRGTEQAPATLPELGSEPAQQLTPRFWQLVDYAFAQADSLGLEMGIHVCDGFALAGGPWITPEESMQKIVFSQVQAVGGQCPELPVPQHYEGYYEDIACYAIPVADYPNPGPSPQRGGELRVTTSPTVTRDEKGTFRASEPGWIQYEYPEAVTCRSIEVIPSGNNLQSQRLSLSVSDDGVTFRPVKQLTPPRQGWQNTDYTLTYAIPKTSARYFRFSWTPEGTEPGSEDLDAAKWKPVLKLKDVRLSPEMRIHQWEGKAGYVWRKAEPATEEEAPAADCPKLTGILRLELQNSKVVNPLPKGNWRVVRIGHTSTGHTNATAGGGKGLECDKFSEAAVRKQVSNWFGLFMQRPHSRVVKYMHVDSWECGSQNWSQTFATEFQRRRGYDLLPWLPVMAGIPVESAAESEQVLRDVRQTIDELKNEVFFRTVSQCARQYGVQLSAESVAPTMMSDGMSHYRYADLPMGEYWLNSPTHDKPNDMLDAISGAHVYGKPIIQAEGFTEVRGVWDETPATVKPLLDRNFALGMNRLFFHVFTHNPYTDKKPGMTLDGIGLFFQRDQTWFPEARGLVDYVTRCQTLLQQGQPVADIAVYTGEDYPRRAFTPDRLVPMLPGLFGPDRVASERQRLANHGLPMTESPVGVSHSAGIPDLKDWVNPLHGYQYDSMNKDALLSQPFHYKVLVIPEGTALTDEVKAKVAQLRRQGVLVIDKPYQQPTIQGIALDLVLPEGIAFTHRTGDGFDIYFLANQTDKEQTFKPVFRQMPKEAVLYNPLNGEAAPYNGAVTLPPYGSLFVCSQQTLSSQPGNTPFPAGELSVPSLGTITQPWAIHFREAGITLETRQLFDWSQHEDDRIRYFSGHARYTTTFKHKGKAAKAVLRLGRVCDVAHVWLNGVDCGIAWTAPYEVDVTKALKKGKNRLEIEVVNTWHNALRGMDQGKPPYEGIWTNAKYRTKGDGLLPAGLLEQPELKTEQ